MQSLARTRSGTAATSRQVHSTRSVRSTCSTSRRASSWAVVPAAATPAAARKAVTASAAAATTTVTTDRATNGSGAAASEAGHGPSHVHLVGISGSIRKHSVNTGLLRAAASQLPPNVTFEILDISQLPLYNDDLWEGKDMANDDSALPEVLRTFRAKVAAADGIVFGCTEYNYSVSSPLKNAIDWCSKSPNLMADKAVSAIGAGGGAGTARAQDHLRTILTGMGAQFAPGTQPPFGGVQVNRYAGAVFDANGDVIDQVVLQRVAVLVTRTADWARKLQLIRA